jgi:hypothetical protein
MKSLKKQFLAIAIIISGFLVALGFFTNLAIRHTIENHGLSLQLEKLALIEAVLARNGRDFLLIESVNPEFFKTGSSPYIDIMDSLFLENTKLLDDLSNNKTIIRLELAPVVGKLTSKYAEMESKFDLLVGALREYGYEDYGLSGVMRKYIHEVESILEARNHYELTSIMLTLRRHEKDFMLRKDPKYLDRFDKTITEFIGRLNYFNVDNSLPNKVLNYQDSFRNLTAKDMEIGTSGDNGVLNDIQQQFDEIDPLINQLTTRITSYSKASVTRYLLILLVAFILIPIFIIGIYSILSGRMVKRLVNLRNYLVQLGDGQLPGQIKKQSDDEIGEMVDSLNNLTDNLRNTREFAIEVGKGNFNTEINVFGNKGDMGGSLIQMKNQLEEVAHNQEFQKLEEKQRTWIAEGTALFARLLRTNNDNPDEMAYTIIFNLVKYLEVNQGGLFFLENEGTENAGFRLAGCYAYERKKFLNLILPEGDGLIGACALEKLPIYLTKLPQSYVTITSGLGQATPDCLFLIPLLHDEKVYGVIELAGFGEMPLYKQEFATKVAENVAAQISVMKTNIQTTELLRQSEEMAENLRQQEEELKQNMEEMMASQEESEKLIKSLKMELAHKDRLLNSLQMKEYTSQLEN